jgi:DNA-binding XRE family transcriptional regulator
MKINGNAFKLAREKSLRSPGSLANISGVSPKTIVNIELGKQNVRPNTVRKVLSGLGLTLEEAFQKNLVIAS